MDARHHDIPARRRMRVALVVAMTLFVSGCSASNDAAGDATATPSPSFTGPWAAEFAQAYSQAQTDFGRSVLEDGDISEQEINEMYSREVQCLKSKGYDAEYTDEGMSFKSKDSSVTPSQMDADDAECRAQSDDGVLGPLYANYHGNPNNEDGAQVLLRCFQRHGLAEETMTVDEFKQIVSDPDRDNEVFGKYFDETRTDYDSTKSPEYWACNSDPSS